jgi:trimeric autotransporter adhesin
MTILYYFRVRATSPPAYEYLWSSTTPTTTLSGGAIDTSQTTVLDTKEVSNTSTSITFADSPFTAGSTTTITADTSSGAITINLPDASTVMDRIYYIFSLAGTNNITVDPFSSQTIDGALTYTITPGNSLVIRSDGANWTTGIETSVDIVFGVPVTNLTAITDNSGGTTGTFARSDHTHAITTGTPSSIGTANSAGTASSLVRSDHVHQGIHSLNVNAGTQRFGDITLQQGGNVTLSDNGSGTFTISSTTASTFTTGTFTATSNQLVLGTTNTTTISATAPSTSRTITIPDPGTTGANFVLTEATQTINGAKTFGSSITAPATTLSNTTNQITLGNTNTTTITAPAPSTSRTITIPDPATASSAFALSNTTTAPTNGQLLIGNGTAAMTPAALTGTTNQINISNGSGSITISTPQNIHSAATPTFASETLTATTDQLVLGTTNTTTISATQPATSRTITIPDPGTTGANFVLTESTQTINGAKTFGSSITAPAATLSNATNQLVLGTTNTTTVNATAPAASRIVTIPDPGTAASFVLTEASQTINGSKTFGSAISAPATTLSNSTNQITMGTTNTTTISATAPSTSRTITLPDPGTTGANFVLTEANQTINGSKTFGSAVTITPSTNQLILGTTNTTTISASAPSTSRTITIPDPGADANFVLTQATQTINGAKTFGSAITITPSTNQLTLGTTNTTTISATAPSTSRTITLPDPATATAAIAMANTTTAPTNGQLLIGNGTAAMTPATLTGTTNQINISNGSGSITLSTPQNIHTAATPTFASETLTATTNQLTLGTTNTITISAPVPVPATSITLTLPRRTATISSEDNNVIRVEKGGNDTTGSRGGSPFLTLTAAIAATGITSGDVIRIAPGTYASETFPITIPSGVSIVGYDPINCIISAPAVTTNTTMFVMGTSSQISNLTISMTSATAALTLKAIAFTGTTAATAKINNCNISISNTTSGAGGTINGIESSGTGVAAADVINLNNTVINVSATTATSGTARALVINAANTMRMRNSTLICTGGGGISAVAAETVTSASATLIARAIHLQGTTNCFLQTAGLIDLMYSNFTNSSSVNTSIINNGRVTFSDVAYTVQTSDSYIAQTGTLTASRAVTLPAANAVPAGTTITIADESGSVTTTNTLVVTRAGSDTIDGATTVTMNIPNCWIRLVSNGTSRWKQAGGTVASYSAYTAGSINNTNTSPVLVTGATITPGGGTYLAIWSASLLITNTAPTVTFSIYANAVIATDSTRTAKTANAGASWPVSTMAIVTVADGQAIEVQAATTANSYTFANRNLLLVRL